MCVGIPHVTFLFFCEEKSILLDPCLSFDLKGMNTLDCSISQALIMNLVFLKQSSRCMEDVKVNNVYSYSVPIWEQIKKKKKQTWLESKTGCDQC